MESNYQICADEDLHACSSQTSESGSLDEDKLLASSRDISESGSIDEDKLLASSRDISECGSSIDDDWSLELPSNPSTANASDTGNASVAYALDQVVDNDNIRKPGGSESETIDEDKLLASPACISESGSLDEDKLLASSRDISECGSSKDDNFSLDSPSNASESGSVDEDKSLQSPTNISECGSSKDDNCSLESPSNARISLFLTGKSGCGKSATGNTILGGAFFICGLLSNLVTRECKKHSVIFCGTTLCVIDSPGFCSINMSNEAVQEKISEFLNTEQLWPIVNVLCISGDGRYSLDDKNTIEHILLNFGPLITENTIVVFTHFNRQKMGMSFKEFLATLPEDLARFVQKCGNRVVAFDNSPEGKLDESQVPEFLKIIHKMVEDRPTQYTKSNYENAQKDVKLQRDTEYIGDKENISKPYNQKLMKDNSPSSRKRMRLDISSS